MITVPELAAEALGSFLSNHLERRFGSTEAGLTELISWVSRLALECIGNSDALYHTVEHTMLVTLVGYDIMKGRSLLMPTSAADYAHVIVACLMHDIGYVRGLLMGDGADGYIIDARGGKTKLPRGASDAALTPHHVDRSKLFALDRLAHMDFIDAPRVARYRIHALSFGHRSGCARRRRRRLAGARRRSHRPARRSALSAQGKRALLRVRRSRHEQTARL
jgi:hypothetical protein